MNTKTKLGENPYKLQVYLPSRVKEALDRYIVENISSDSRLISTVVRKAVTEYLERQGYLEKPGGEKDVDDLGLPARIQRP